MSPNPYVKSLFIRILWCCIWFQDVSTIRTFSIEMHYWFRFISSEVSISGTLSLAVLLFIWCAFAVWYLGKTPREFRARGNQGNRVVLTSTCVRLDLNILGFLWSVSQICRLVVPVVTLSYRGSNQQFSKIFLAFSLCRWLMVQWQCCRTCCRGGVYFLKADLRSKQLKWWCCCSPKPGGFKS